MWTLRSKILIGYAAALGVAGVVLGVALVHIVRLGRASAEILQENYRSILAAEEMLNAITAQENAAMQMVIGVQRNNVLQFSESEKRFLVWLERAKANITIRGESEIVARIEKEHSEFLFRLAEFRNDYLDDPQAGLQFYEEHLSPQATIVRTGCRELHDLNRRTMEASSSRARTLAQRAVWFVAAIGVVVIGGAFLGSIWLSNRLVRPIGSLIHATERVASGDYNLTIDVESKDEVGLLAQKFNVMLTKLRAYHDLNLRRIVGEQKKAEVILQTIDDGVLVIGADRRITSLNPTAAKILGVHRLSVEGRDYAEIVKDEELAEFIGKTLQDTTSSRIKTAERILTRQGGQDQQSHYQYDLTPITAPDGNLIGLVVLFRNVTALKELDRLKTEFVMTASHELRTPLTSMAMSIELLREKASGKLDEAGQQMLEVAHEELERLRTLVDELLDLSKIESGKFEIELSDVSIPTILEGAVAPFRAQAKELSIKLNVSSKEGLPMLRADPNKIAWVVTNLVGNALRYAHSRVEVSAEKAGRWVNLYVLDDGDGIPHEQQARIFDKFVQAKGDMRPGGAGLGLAISKEIVKAHQGNIWVESEPGKGTLFIVALPVAKQRNVE